MAEGAALLQDVQLASMAWAHLGNIPTYLSCVLARGTELEQLLGSQVLHGLVQV